ncbi:putative calcium-binding protein CML34 [Raphanus sativus]|nr:putative calcium-binding protein CML34 [Raphanus sativus]
MSAKQIFEKFDKNKTGKLSLDEFREAVLAFSLNISEEEVTQTFKEIDVDGDGVLNSDEFTSSVENMLKEAFSLCDADGDGKITSSEFHAAMIGLGRSALKRNVQRWLKPLMQMVMVI